MFSLKRFTEGALILRDLLGYWALNSSLVMSLGAGAWRVSGWPDATSREEVSMATLEAWTTPKAATNRHRHTEKRKFQWICLPVRKPTWKLVKKPPATRQGGRRGSENPQRFAKKEQLIRYDQQAKQQCNITFATSPHRGPATPQRATPHVTYCNRWQPQANLLEFNFT